MKKQFAFTENELKSLALNSAYAAFYQKLIRGFFMIKLIVNLADGLMPFSLIF